MVLFSLWYSGLCSLAASCHPCLAMLSVMASAMPGNRCQGCIKTGSLQVTVSLSRKNGEQQTNAMSCRRVESCILTDLPDMLDHLRLNVERNKALIQQAPQFAVRSVTWAANAAL